MSISQKFIPPDIAREELTPRELELVAMLEQLTDMVNRQQERLQALEQEIAGLRKAGKRA
jgi:phage gp16-like protein